MKLNHSDVTFVIPIYYDHIHRKQNVHLTIRYLQKYLVTNIILMEQYIDAPFFEYLGRQVKYTNIQSDVFHRTKMLNEMIRMADTPVVVNWDADVIVSPEQHRVALEYIKSGGDIVYPYDGTFIRLNRPIWIEPLSKALDLKILTPRGQKKERTASVGGAVYFNRDSFINGGMENENFISYGPEDLERHYRFTTLGYNLKRVKGPIYHMEHHMGLNSYKKHPNYQSNLLEWEKVKTMDKSALGSYVEEWKWIK